MRLALILMLPAFLSAADATDHPVHAITVPPTPVLEPARETTADDLQNLAACARMHIGNLTPAQMQAVAVAIQHAEADVIAIRADAASRSTTAAAVQGSKP